MSFEKKIIVSTRLMVFARTTALEDNLKKDALEIQKIMVKEESDNISKINTSAHENQIRFKYAMNRSGIACPLENRAEELIKSKGYKFRESKYL